MSAGKRDRFSALGESPSRSVIALQDGADT